MFEAKGREPHRSLPLLVRDTLMAEELAGELNNRFFLLARRFWPGPLTIIVPASAKVPLQGHRQHRPAGAAAIALRSRQRS